ncbi:MAG: NUDIX hydrolase [Treponema sp.]|nr:NUDIX hydrolase [Treponema sp.]
MDKPHLTWTETGKKQVFDCKIFSVNESYCKSPIGNEPQTFTVIDAKDWAIVIPVIETSKGKHFLMVWQWRHGSKCLSLEFPGGVFEPGENPEQAAARELYEETGYKPRKIKKIGEFSPNPAIMSNKVHFFLAEDLIDTGKQELDEDEYVEIALVNEQEVIQGMGKPPFVHALMGTALALYNQGGNYK